MRTRYGATRFSMLGSHPGAVIVARVELPGIGPLTCVSVYGVINVYSQTTMFRVIADLIPLFDSRDGERVVLGGDFNVSTAVKHGDTDTACAVSAKTPHHRWVIPPGAITKAQKR